MLVINIADYINDSFNSYLTINTKLPSPLFSVSICIIAVWGLALSVFYTTVIHWPPNASAHIILLTLCQWPITHEALNRAESQADRQIGWLPLLLTRAVNLTSGSCRETMALFILYWHFILIFSNDAISIKYVVIQELLNLRFYNRKHSSICIKENKHT